jgi:ParB family transcriptional regulator, chromosome partitioning protein
MNNKFDPQIRMIAVNSINVLNPRERGKKKFAQIVVNIGNLGLKKPITVAYSGGSNDDTRYDLVCGQGRLEAYIELGEEFIPALIVEGSKEDLLLMSLAENLARRSHSTVELVREISALKERGYSQSEIAKKIDLHPTYVKALLQLLAKGEERLLQAVEKGLIPVNVAITIATSSDKAVQRALQEAYERNDLKGKALIRARRLIESRRIYGKGRHRGPRRNADKDVSADEILKVFQNETVKQRMIIQRAKICETRLLFAVSAIKRLFEDDHFVTLLRAEGLDTLPNYLAEQLNRSGVNNE